MTLLCCASDFGGAEALEEFLVDLSAYEEKKQVPFSSTRYTFFYLSFLFSYYPAVPKPFRRRMCLKINVRTHVARRSDDKTPGVW
jgi:hypothetical protein